MLKRSVFGEIGGGGVAVYRDKISVKFKTVEFGQGIGQVHSQTIITVAEICSFQIIQVVIAEIVHPMESLRAYTYPISHIQVLH